MFLTYPMIAHRGFKLPRPEFEKLLLEAVDQGLSSLGESSKQAIYFHLEKIYGVNRQDIPKKPAEFISAVEKLFGPGAKYLETLFSERLREKTGLKNHLSLIDVQGFAQTVVAVKKAMEL